MTVLSPSIIKNKSYRLVRKRFENLKDVIFYETIAKENDSILSLTKMSENQLEDFFQPYVENLIAKQKKHNSLKKKSNKRKINLVNDNKGVSKGGFYFYQTTTVAYGKNAFINFWGKGHWRIIGGGHQNLKIKFQQSNYKTMILY